MISLLQDIVDYFVCWVMTGIVLALNFVIQGLADFIAGLLLLLPPMPDMPSVPAMVQQGFNWGGYFFPLAFIVTLFGIYITLWIAWTLIAIPLRWGKVTNE